MNGQEVKTKEPHKQTTPTTTQTNTTDKTLTDQLRVKQGETTLSLPLRTKPRLSQRLQYQIANDADATSSSIGHNPYMPQDTPISVIQ